MSQQKQQNDDDMSVSGILARLDERTKTMADDIDSLKHVLLEGNGVPPITVQVATLTEQNKAQDKQIDDLKAERKQGRADRAVIWAALIGGAISIGEMLLRHLHVI